MTLKTSQNISNDNLCCNKQGREKQVSNKNFLVQTKLDNYHFTSQIQTGSPVHKGHLAANT